MSRRREANRAEAIVRGVGALFMLLVLVVMIYALPQILEGKSPKEMLETMMHTIVGFVVLGGVISVIGLIVWIKVIRGKKGRDDF